MLEKKRRKENRKNHVIDRILPSNLEFKDETEDIVKLVRLF